ncbi:hypothetical protein [Ulvibacter antarcticus]|uniref:SdiA-regulated protein n=1 Tax=Ulvibacter antarcticus TaxID=442714 RepID=A0A3L9YLQ1_9FLAO|nr:hypothetical protein [Ulvibacter antarcticus]RMA58938.1 hypothetical protein BXY75_2320 [Ulvibacter antarcticus]
MKNIIILLLISFSTASCQDFGKLSIVASFPNSMKEVSGLETIEGSPLIWVLGDSGSEPAVYGFNPKKESFDKVITLTNVVNHDWEDLAKDRDGNLYIGDFGNNHNSRKNLAIYTLRNVSEITETKSEVAITNFTLEDQNSFKIKKKDRNYDIEAFFYLNENFYLFTRNRSNNFDGVSKVYRVPAQSGNFEAKLIGTFKTCNDRKDCEVTAATIDFSSGRIALLTYNKVFIIDDYKDEDFLNGKIKKIKLEHTSQKESIGFKDSNTLYIADERNGAYGGNLYELKLDL